MIYLASRAPDCVRHVAERARAVVARGGGRGARRDSGGRFARPHAPHVATARRAVALAVLALVLLVPTVARAEIATLPGSDGGLVAPYPFSAKGRYGAAAEAIGRNYDTLTDEQQDYIVSYDNFGSNSFVEFAMSMKNLGYEMNAQLATWSLVFPFYITNYGATNVWWYLTTDSEALDDARRDYDLAWSAYLNEHGFGGSGGEGGVTDDGTNLTFTTVTQRASLKSEPLTITGVASSAVRNYTDGYKYGMWDQSSIDTYNLTASDSQYWKGKVRIFPDTATVNVQKSLVNSYLEGNDAFAVILNNDIGEVWIYLLPTGHYSFNYGTIEGPNATYSSLSVTVDDGYTGRYMRGNGSWEQLSSEAAVKNVTSISNNNTFNGTSDISPYNNAVGYSGATGSIGGGPVYPDPPQPPEIPEPDPPETRPIDDPGITLPPINFPDLVLPDIDYTVQTPSGTDVVPYLKKIIANQEDIASFLSDALGILDQDLDNIGEALGEHCNHLQQQMQKQVYWLAQELQDMFDGLEVGISNYLYRVQTKLLQGIGWEFDNLSQDVISWLKRIYSRLGGNGISKPDPTTDTKGFWDWLVEQFTKFFEELFGKSTSGLNSLFDSLKDFFPFSLPWDIAALLGLFVHEPVTPVFDLPMPVPEVISGTKMQLIHVDCHPWDGTMQIVRGLEFVFFAYYLMRMVPSWFNEIKVTGM